MINIVIVLICTFLVSEFYTDHIKPNQNRSNLVNPQKNGYTVQNKVAIFLLSFGALFSVAKQ